VLLLSHQQYDQSRHGHEIHSLSGEPVTVIQAVTEYLADAKARELSDATVYKLDIFFRKQFLAWWKAEGYKLLREIDLRAVQAFRTSWKDGAMAKKKKQERLTGFFRFCIRANWITMNPTNNLGRISSAKLPLTISRGKSIKICSTRSASIRSCPPSPS
jgi:site-specific recombinase XerD